MAEPEKKQGAESWQVTAMACEMLAFSLRYPTPQLAAAVASGEWAEAAAEIAQACGWQVEPRVLEGALSADANGAVPRDAQDAVDEEALLHVLRAEATRLFVGAPTPAVSPYEGIWRAEDDGVQGLLFVNPHSMAVERFMKSCGLGRPEGTNEPLDHAATELELLQYLAALAGGAEPAEGCPGPDALPGGSAQAAYGQFAEQHARTWLPRFAAKLATQTRLPYYRAAAALLAAFLAE